MAPRSKAMTTRVCDPWSSQSFDRTRWAPAIRFAVRQWCRAAQLRIRKVAIDHPRGRSALAPVLAAALLALAGSTAQAESVRYAAYKLLPGGEKELVAQGTRDYSPAKDVQPDTRCSCQATDEPNLGLSLFGGYSLEVGPATDDPSAGFGLIIADGSRQSFSWNWFSPPHRLPWLIAWLIGKQSEPADIFVQRHTGGRVRVVTRTVRDDTQLESVEFLDDVTLNFTDDMTLRPADVDSHEFVILKGSTLRLPSP